MDSTIKKVDLFQKFAYPIKSKVRTSLFFIFFLPRNVLLPGESEDVEFTMTSGVDTKMNSTAICVVLGGPEYRFTLTGESSTVGFLLNKSVIDFKNVNFVGRKDEELIISNTGKVIINYAISGSLKGLGLFDITPISGECRKYKHSMINYSINL